MVVRKVLFRIDPETIHDRTIRAGALLSRRRCTRAALSCLFGYRNAALTQEILGIRFLNPVGLAAGFDKDGLLVDLFPSIGFGFAEIGSITGEPCEGNPKPRLWRLPRSKGLVVYYGLKNRGCESVAASLRQRKLFLPIGTSIAMTNSENVLSLDAAIADYVKSFRALREIGAYFAVNISCPNTFGGEPFTDPQRLDPLLGELDRIPTTKPVFLKLPPNLSEETLEGILDVASRHRVHGFICTNLTKQRSNPKILDSVPDRGGISGLPLRDAADATLASVARKTRGKYVLIGCGGIFTAQDAYRKIRLGASLVQLITGLIFKGPQLVSELNQGIAALLRRDGFITIREAIGVDLPITSYA